MGKKLFLAALMMATATSIEAQTFTEWQNAYVNQVNRLENHASYKTDEPKLTLNGQWKFKWVEHADQRPTPSPKKRQRLIRKQEIYVSP